MTISAQGNWEADVKLPKFIHGSAVSDVPTREYLTLLKTTLDRFYEDYCLGLELVAEAQNIESDAGFQSWGAKYTRWQQQSQRGKDLKRELAASSPKEQELAKLHNGLVILMNNRNIEQTQTFNMMLRIMKDDHPGANEARDAASRAEKDGDAALTYCQKQLARMRRDNPRYLELLGLPDWVLEM
jgi:hypothetical protein